MNCTLDKLLEVMDEKIKRAQKSIEVLKNEIDDCKEEEDECIKAIKEIQCIPKDPTK